MTGPILVLPFYVAGAVSDWRTRTAPNWLWAVSAWLGFVTMIGTESGGPRLMPSADPCPCLLPDADCEWLCRYECHDRAFNQMLEVVR